MVILVYFLLLCFVDCMVFRNFADAILFLWISVIIYIVAGVGCVG